ASRPTASRSSPACWIHPSSSGMCVQWTNNGDDLTLRVSLRPQRSCPFCPDQRENPLGGGPDQRPRMARAGEQNLGYTLLNRSGRGDAFATLFKRMESEADVLGDRRCRDVDDAVECVEDGRV